MRTVEKSQGCFYVPAYVHATLQFTTSNYAYLPSIIFVFHHVNKYPHKILFTTQNSTWHGIVFTFSNWRFEIQLLL